MCIRDRLYAAAFHKRNMEFGPLGPGGIYAVDVNGRGVTSLFRATDAGANNHDLADNLQPDERSRRHAGKTSLGDIDLSPDGKQLYVMNLFNRKIQRFSLPDGKLLGSIANGGASENWAADARPFGLAFHEGWLFHAVVNSSETVSYTHLDVYKRQPRHRRLPWYS